jgi:hypothetical protein
MLLNNRQVLVRPMAGVITIATGALMALLTIAIYAIRRCLLLHSG